MIHLSAVIITYNEERHIGHCIASLQGIADEIVVLDSYSTDQTEAICHSYAQVRFVQQPFVGYGQQKNAAIDQAQHRYILSLDADEVLSDELRQQILAVKNDWRFDAYGFNRRNYCCGYWVRHGGWYPDRKLRLFDRRKAVWAGSNPHEHLALTRGATSSWLSGDLWHNTLESMAHFAAQNNRYSTLQAEDRWQRGQRSVGWYHLAAKPCWRFISTYFLQLGFLDGKMGFIIACQAAHTVFLRYAKLYERSRLKSQ